MDKQKAKGSPDRRSVKSASAPLDGSVRPTPTGADPPGIGLAAARVLALQAFVGNRATLSVLHPDRPTPAATSGHRLLRLQRQPAPPGDQLDVQYGAAVAAGQWDNAAIHLNGFNSTDIIARLALLNHDQLIWLYTAALGALTGVSQRRILDPIARRDLDAAYQACVRTAHWELAVVNLSSFNNVDLQTKVAALTPAQLTAMKSVIPLPELVSRTILAALIVVIPHGADASAVSVARARATEIFGSLKAANTAQLLTNERIELHILPRPPTKLTDLPEFATLRGVPTHDGRLYNDLRGVGGQRTGNVIQYVLAEEQLITVPGASTTYGPGFVSSHESAHIVHQYSFSPEQTAALRRLYVARRSAGGPWLNPASYTSANQDEYFAQSASAYFSRPYSASTEDRTMYTREWLRANDPAMLSFLQTIFR